MSNIIMRAIINIPDEQIMVLNQLSKKQKLSRAALIRQAVTLYINNTNKIEREIQNIFGIWKNKNIDSVNYQQKLRAEWTDK